MKSSPRKNKVEFFEIHPQTIKHLKLGHPWATKDSFTEKFPKKPSLIATTDKNQKETWIFINDPDHPMVKARHWGDYSNSKIKITNFWNDFQLRLEESINFREEQKLFEERQNYYLASGEADRLPGLQVLRLNETILVQTYCGFWEYYSKTTLRILKLILSKQFPMTPFRYFIQSRNKNKKIKVQEYNYKNELVPAPKNFNFEVEEFGVKYNLSLAQSYDIGIYTDMSSNRKKIMERLNEGQNLLNLFSYTGAFSLAALKKNLKEVHSVDLSESYLNILQSNIELNQFDNDNHHSHKVSVEDFLKKSKKENKRFDHIVCDPPSSSSDGKKVSNALKNYEVLLPLMANVLNQHGELYLFLNTHSITWKKFENEIVKHAEKLGLEKQRRLTPSEDVKKLKGFPEGDYLKGLILKKVK